MATISTSKRITRLKSREPSARPERKLKPRKVATINQNSQKINVGVKNKSLHISKGNIYRRSSPTLLTRLRPQRNRKNYCEDSRLLEQYILPKQQDSLVVLEKLNLEMKKVPVYKATESSEKSMEDNNDVYDFKFDINDTTEKVTKKKQRKRNINQKKGKMAKKTTRKKVAASSKAIVCEVIKSPELANLSLETAQNDPPLELKITVKSTKEDIAKNIETLEKKIDIQVPEESMNKDIEEEIESPRIDIHTSKKSTENTIEIIETSRTDINVQAVKEAILPSKTFTEQIRKKDLSKPRVISIENANNIIITKSPNNSKDSLPFRPKNIFENKTLTEHNGTLNSLLTKTLSPILKTANTLELGSPWRPPTSTFSHTKHFIQSTPYRNFGTHKENKEINKETMKMNEENMEMDKENMDIKKENKGRKDKERKKKKIGFHEKPMIQKKLPKSENQNPEKIRTAVAGKSVVQQSAPVRVSLGEIKNLLQRPNINGDNKQANDQTHIEVDKSMEQKNKKLVEFLNFSDTFDVLSESERVSNIGDNAPLFMDLEPSYFSKPPQHSYRRKRAVKFDFSENSDEEKKEVKLHTKKKKLTKSEKEHEKRINEWVKTVNTTFQEIEEYDLIIE